MKPKIVKKAAKKITPAQAQMLAKQLGGKPLTRKTAWPKVG